MKKEENALWLLVALAYRCANDDLLDYNEPIKVHKMQSPMSLNEAYNEMFNLIKGETK